MPSCYYAINILHPLFFVLVAFQPGVCQDILIGQTTALTGTQNFFGLSYSVGLNVSLQEANGAGGVGGRPLRQVLLDDSYNVTRGQANLNQLLDVHNVLLVAGTYGTPISADPQFLSRIVTTNVPFVGPCTGSPLLHSPFRRQVINIRASYQDEMLVMATFITQTLRMQRVAFLYQKDYIGAGFLAQLSAALTPVGISLVASGGNTPGKTDVEEAVQAVASSPVPPQVVVFTTLEPSSVKFIQLYFNDSRANRNCVMILFSLNLTPNFPTQVAPAYWRNLLFTSVVPLQDDPSLAIIQRFQQALRTYAPTATPNQVMVEGYITGRLIVDVLRGIPGPNITRELFLAQLYNTRLFLLDDLPVGLYGDSRSGCASLLCSCNSGLRSVFMARLNLTTGLPFWDPSLTSLRYPITQCSVDASTLLAPIVFGQLVPTGNVALQAVAADVGAGLRAAFAEANAADTTGRPFQLVEAPYAGDPGAAAAALVDRYPVLALLGSVVPTSAALNATVPRIGTLDAEPNALAPAFDPADIRVQPSLELELMALVSFAVLQSCPLHFRAPDTALGRAAVAALVKSANTWRQTPASAAAYSDVSSVLPGVPDGCLVVVAGADDVRAVFAGIAARPGVRLLTTAAAAMQLMATAGFPNLPAGQLYYPSLAVGGAAWKVGGNMSEAWRYGYLVAQMAIQGLQHSRFASQKFNTPAQLLEAVNVVKTATYEGVTLGPYFLDRCAVGGPPDQYCGCNLGARSLSILRGNALPNSSTPEYVYSMLGCSVAYQPLPPPFVAAAGVPWGPVIGGVVAAVVGLAALLGAAWAAGRRSHRAAPKDGRASFCVLFTDIQSSTHLWATLPEEMAAALIAHHTILRRQIARHGIYEVKTIGDSFMCAAKTPQQAVRFAVAVQTALFEHKWGTAALDVAYQAFVSPNPSARDSPWNGLRVRIGLHYGMGDIQFDPVAKSYDYYGTVVNTAARIESAAHGGQIAISKAVHDAVQDAGLPLVCTDLGSQRLRGLAEPLQLYQVLPEGPLARRTFPPLRLDAEAPGGDPTANIGVPVGRPRGYSVASHGSLSTIDVKPLPAHGPCTPARHRPTPPQCLSQPARLQRAVIPPPKPLSKSRPSRGFLSSHYSPLGVAPAGGGPSLPPPSIAPWLRHNYDVAMTTIRTLLVTQTKKFKETVLNGLCERLQVHNYGSEGAHFQRTLHSLVYRVLPATVVGRVSAATHRLSICTASTAKLRGAATPGAPLSAATAPPRNRQPSTMSAVSNFEEQQV